MGRCIALWYLLAWADSWSTLHGGFAFYQYSRTGTQGWTKRREASEGARRAWMRTNNRTQQSGYLADLNAFQANQGLYRYMTVFFNCANINDESTDGDDQ